jgi:ADP-ribose pyrophosphatase YjhB (NUDIX family)
VLPVLPEPPAFCPRCGEAMPAPGAGERPACAHDHYTWYPDPKVATGVVVERDGRILLVRRNHEPAYGRWAFPSGYVDAGEVVEEAAAREVLEETGLAVELQALLGVWSEPGRPVIFVAYAARALEGEPAPGDEAIEVAFFDPSDLPPLPFPHDLEVMAAWRSRRTPP